MAYSRIERRNTRTAIAICAFARAGTAQNELCERHGVAGKCGVAEKWEYNQVTAVKLQETYDNKHVVTFCDDVPYLGGEKMMEKC